MQQNNRVTQDRLKNQLNYNPRTGDFTWQAARSGVKLGSTAGAYTLNGYRNIQIDCERVMSHQLAWLYVYGRWPDDQIDHINGIRDDNRIENLRDVTHTENMHNQKRPKNNRSGVVGVSWAGGRSDKWYATICVHRKFINLGHYEDFFEAVCARKSAELKYNYHPNHGRSK